MYGIYDQLNNNSRKNHIQDHPGFSKQTDHYIHQKQTFALPPFHPDELAAASESFGDFMKHFHIKLGSFKDRNAVRNRIGMPAYETSWHTAHSVPAVAGEIHLPRYVLRRTQEPYRIACSWINGVKYIERFYCLSFG
jgi:hypothetical protein